MIYKLKLLIFIENKSRTLINLKKNTDYVKSNNSIRIASPTCWIFTYVSSIYYESIYSFLAKCLHLKLHTLWDLLYPPPTHYKLIGITFSVCLCNHDRSMSFLWRNIESFYFTQRLLMPCGCVMFLTHCHLGKVKVIERKGL